MSCRFCHLTQTKQTDFKEATTTQILDQARRVIKHYVNMVALELQKPVKTVHFNWMARGEPLASSVLKMNWDTISKSLKDMANAAGVEVVKFKISTIIPTGHGFDKATTNPLVWFFNTELKPVFYYSLYSTSKDFRKKWLPKAIDPEMALYVLKQWQLASKASVVLHWAFIKDQNDSKQEVESILELVKKSGIQAKFNLVRYNPFDEENSQESELDVVNVNFRTISQQMLLEGSRIVPRVGFDIAASCGMFIKI